MAINLIRVLNILLLLSLSSQVTAMESKIGPATIRKFFVAPGKITTNPDRSAHVSPRYEGLVTKVFVSAGDQVKKGAPLAKIERNDRH